MANSQQKVDNLESSLNHRLHTWASEKSYFSCFIFPRFLGQCALTPRISRFRGALFS
jgi:hypothetical protein